MLVNVVKTSGANLGSYNDIFVIPSSTQPGKFTLTLRDASVLTATEIFQIAYHVIGR